MINIYKHQSVNHFKWYQEYNPHQPKEIYAYKIFILTNINAKKFIFPVINHTFATINNQLNKKK